MYSREMHNGTPNSLKKYTCLEWRDPVNNGDSKHFLLQNQKCRLALYDDSHPFKICNDSVYDLFIHSNSNDPLSFEVDVLTFTDKYGSDTGFSTINVERHIIHDDINRFTYQIWRGMKNEIKCGIFSFILTFMNTSNIQLREDANANIGRPIQSNCYRRQLWEEQQIPWASSYEKQRAALKKLFCLTWVLDNSPPVSPRYRTSPKFLINNQPCFFTCIRQTKRLKQVQFTLAIDSSEPNELLDNDIARDFDVTVHVVRNDKKSTFEGRKTVKRIPEYDLWTSRLEKSDPDKDIHSFRVYFPSCLNIELIQDADEQATTVSEEGSSTSEQFTQTPSFLDSELSHRSLSSDLGKLLLNNDFTSDITIQCGECTIPAHRNILETRSNVLKIRLAKSDTRILQIVDMEASVCKKFIEYLYTASLPDLSVTLAAGLCEAGMKYGVDSLQRQCSDFLRENLSNVDMEPSVYRKFIEYLCTASLPDLSVELALGLYEAGKKYGVNSLQRQCYEFLREIFIIGNLPRDIDDILSSSQWATFCKSNPKLAVKVYQRAHKKTKYA